MTMAWTEQRDTLCSKIENDFHLQKFKNRDFPIVALTSNDRISTDVEFKNNMIIDGKKDLATIGDTVIDFLIMEHFLNSSSQKTAQELNVIREKFGNNRTLHLISKTQSVNLNNYIVKTDNERCGKTGKTCLSFILKR